MRTRVILGAALGTGVAVVAAIVFPTRVETVVVVWASAMLVWAAFASSTAMRKLVPASGDDFESLLRGATRRRTRPEDLERCERILSWRRYSARDFDHHLRPLLVGLMQHRLQNSSSVPAPELAVLVDDVPAARVYPKGVTTAELERIVTAIEAL
jgi:hypothetical protein